MIILEVTSQTCLYCCICRNSFTLAYFTEHLDCLPVSFNPFTATWFFSPSMCISSAYHVDQLTDFHEAWCERWAIDIHQYYILLSFLQSIVLTWWLCKLLKWKWYWLHFSVVLQKCYGCSCDMACSSILSLSPTSNKAVNCIRMP